MRHRERPPVEEGHLYARRKPRQRQGKCEANRARADDRDIELLGHDANFGASPPPIKPRLAAQKSIKRLRRAQILGSDHSVSTAGLSHCPSGRRILLMDS